MVHLTRQAVFQSFFGNSICRWLPRLACSPHVPAFLYLSAGMRAPLAVGFTALGDGGFHRFDTGNVGAHLPGLGHLRFEHAHHPIGSLRRTDVSEETARQRARDVER
jgi:hypothetical protein